MKPIKRTIKHRLSNITNPYNYPKMSIYLGDDNWPRFYDNWLCGNVIWDNLSINNL